MRATLLMLALAGCKPVLKGWWDIDRWTVSREGADKPLVRTDAGVVVWQAEGLNLDYGYAYLVLRYDYDPVAFALVPDPDPEQSSQTWSFDEWDEDQPVVLAWPEGEDGVYVEATFEVLDFQATKLTLEGPSPLEDGSIWTWDLAR